MASFPEHSLTHSAISACAWDRLEPPMWSCLFVNCSKWDTMLKTDKTFISEFKQWKSIFKTPVKDDITVLDSQVDKGLSCSAGNCLAPNWFKQVYRLSQVSHQFLTSYFTTDRVVHKATLVDLIITPDTRRSILGHEAVPWGCARNQVRARNHGISKRHV